METQNNPSEENQKSKRVLARILLIIATLANCAVFPVMNINLNIFTIAFLTVIFGCTVIGWGNYLQERYNAGFSYGLASLIISSIVLVPIILYVTLALG